MAVISFLDRYEHNWVVARWVYRQILEDVVSQHPLDSDMVKELRDAMELDGLLVYRLEPSLASRVTNAIRQVATGVWSGLIRSGIHDKPYGDPHTVNEYLKGLKRLLAAIPPTTG
jgi:hypothetical protein